MHGKRERQESAIQRLEQTIAAHESGPILVQEILQAAEDEREEEDGGDRPLRRSLFGYQRPHLATRRGPHEA